MVKIRAGSDEDQYALYWLEPGICRVKAVREVRVEHKHNASAFPGTDTPSIRDIVFLIVDAGCELYHLTHSIMWPLPSYSLRRELLRYADVDDLKSDVYYLLWNIINRVAILYWGTHCQEPCISARVCAQRRRQCQTEYK